LYAQVELGGALLVGFAGDNVLEAFEFERGEAVSRRPLRLPVSFIADRERDLPRQFSGWQRRGRSIHGVF